MGRHAGKGLLILALAFVASGAHAQPVAAPEPLEIKLVRTKVVLSGGKEIRQSASTAKPGETLEEVVTYTNRSNSALTSLEATLPVPANTELVMASIRPDTAQASIDGKNFAPMPLKRMVRRADGQESEQLVPVSDYRFLRWYPGALRPASSLVFSARFKVENEAAVAVLPGNSQSSNKQ